MRPHSISQCASSKSFLIKGWKIFAVFLFQSWITTSSMGMDSVREIELVDGTASLKLADPTGSLKVLSAGNAVWLCISYQSMTIKRECVDGDPDDIRILLRISQNLTTETEAELKYGMLKPLPPRQELPKAKIYSNAEGAETYIFGDEDTGFAIRNLGPFSKRWVGIRKYNNTEIKYFVAKEMKDYGTIDARVVETLKKSIFR